MVLIDWLLNQKFSGKLINSFTSFFKKYLQKTGGISRTAKNQSLFNSVEQVSHFNSC